MGIWPQMSQDPLNKKRKGGYIGLHLKYDSILFLLLPGWQIQCSGSDGKSNTYFDQDMQDFGGANLTFVQRMKQKSSNNIISETLQEREVEYVGTAFWECRGDKDCDSSLGMPRTNWIYRSLGTSRTRSPASKLTDGRECTISKAKYLSFMEWKIFDCKWATNMKIKRGKKKKKTLPGKLYCRRKISTSWKLQFLQSRGWQGKWSSEMFTVLDRDKPASAEDVIIQHVFLKTDLTSVLWGATVGHWFFFFFFFLSEKIVSYVLEEN